MKKKFFAKKLLTFCLMFAMIFSSMPLSAFADEQGSSAKTAEVTLSYQAENVFVTTPQKVTVSSDLAESYGYTDSVTDGVSALDVLVKLHEMNFGTDNQTDVTNNLVLSDSGWITKVMGETTSAFSFAVDGEYPCDKSTYGQYGYTGYTINQAPVEDGGNVEFFCYADTDTYSDYYTYFEQNKARVDEISAETGKEISLNLQGYIYAYGSAYTKQDRLNPNKGALGAVADSQLVTVNAETGEMTNIAGAVTDSKGDVKISFDKTGTYYVSAISSDSKDIICPWLTVTVGEAASNTVDVDFKGLHSAQLNSLKVYTYTDGTKGEADLLDGKTTVADGWQLKYETVKLAAGDYLVEGYDSKGDCNGSIVVTVDGSKDSNEFTVRRAYEIYATNSGWALDQDYSVSVKVTGADGTDRKAVIGKAGDKASCIYLNGDTVEATLTAIGDKADSFMPAKVTKTSNQTTTNVSISDKLAAAYTLTVNAPAGSVISAGNFKNYYTYDFAEANITKDDETGVTAVFRIGEAPGDSYMNYNHHFIRVQNPEGVTY